MTTTIVARGAPCPWLTDQYNCKCPCEGCRHHCAAHWSQFAWLDMGFSRPVRVDHEADMGYIEIDHVWPEKVVTDLTHEDDGILTDRALDGHVLGIEIFLSNGRVRPESEAVIRRLLASRQGATP